MKRFLFTLLVIFMFSVPALASDVRIRSDVMIDTDVVRLGDLFDGVEDMKSDTPIARSPQPGNHVMLTADWLYAVAQKYNLNWKPDADFSPIKAVRNSVLVTPDQVMTLISQELLDKNLGQEFEIQLDKKLIDIHLPADAQAFHMNDFVIDPVSKRFSASLSSGNNKIVVAGRAVTMKEVPVFNKRMSRDDVISARDLDYVMVRENDINPQTVMDPQKLVGKALRRAYVANQPIQENYVDVPVMVKKNSLVTIILENPEMMLTAQGRALMDGAQGDTIRVMNTVSSRTIDAVVDDQNRVIVRMSNQIALR